jgi:hypothetical protein
MSWTSVSEALPDEGVECLLSCMQPDGSVVQAIGYLQDGEWVIETDDPQQRNVTVRQWKLFASARKLI